MKYAVAFDTTTVVDDSIREVMQTLVGAIVIVSVVIFLFLQDRRATIIPAVTIPVSLVGTFAFIKVFGFSINSLTPFRITLATGLVVDDAIVVIENVQRHISEGEKDAHKATSVAMSEVTGAVIATSLVLISVFIPVSFFPGTFGILYKQFSLTIAFSIAISAFNALTLSPALAALLLRRRTEGHGVLHVIDTGIKGLSSEYASFTSNDPQLTVDIDREKAKALGVPFSQITGALQVYMGSEYVNNFDSTIARIAYTFRRTKARA